PRGPEPLTTTRPQGGTRRDHLPPRRYRTRTRGTRGVHPSVDGPAPVPRGHRPPRAGGGPDRRPTYRRHDRADLPRGAAVYRPGGGTRRWYGQWSAALRAHVLVGRGRGPVGGPFGRGR